MRILLYEFVTGGGLWATGDDPTASSLLPEGQAMVTALATDLAGCPDTEVTLFRDSRLANIDAAATAVVEIKGAEEERAQLIEAAASSDLTWLIAPETDGQLANRCRDLERAGARLASPSCEFVELTSDKLQTNRFLRSQRIPVPLSRAICGRELPDHFPYPAVLKPRDGAGSAEVQAISRQTTEIPASTGERCLEQFHSGLASSVAVISGPSGIVILPACRQLISDDGRFRYRGGVTPLESDLADRAHRLAHRVAHALPAATGYFGIDLILGSASDGSKDVVLEVNPRLTSSYLGLRQLAKSNLAAAILAILDGRQEDLSFSEEPIEFSPVAQ